MRAILLSCLCGLAAWAGEPEAGVTPVEVEVGRVVEKSVGIARGLFCDDPAVVRAEIETGGNANRVTFKGLKPGATLCRAGTDPGLPSQLFRVSVVPAK